MSIAATAATVATTVGGALVKLGPTAKKLCGYLGKMGGTMVSGLKNVVSKSGKAIKSMISGNGASMAPSLGALAHAIEPQNEGFDGNDPQKNQSGKGGLLKNVANFAGKSAKYGIVATVVYQACMSFLNMTKGMVQESQILRSKAVGTNFAGSTFKNSFLVGNNFKKANFAKSDFDFVVMSNSKLDGADFSDCTLKDVNFNGCTAKGANWKNAKLINCQYGGTMIKDPAKCELFRDGKNVDTMSVKFISEQDKLKLKQASADTSLSYQPQPRLDIKPRQAANDGPSLG